MNNGGRTLLRDLIPSEGLCSGCDCGGDRVVRDVQVFVQGYSVLYECDTCGGCGIVAGGVDGIAHADEVIAEFKNAVTEAKVHGEWL